MVVKTTVELPRDLADALKPLAKASDLNRPQYIRRVLASAAAKKLVFEPSEFGPELMAAEPPPPYRSDSQA